MTAVHEPVNVPATPAEQQRATEEAAAELRRFTKTNIPSGLESHEKMKLRAAAQRARRVYPGPVGELLCREIMTWEEFGYRLGSQQLIMRIVDHVMKAEIPPTAPFKSPTEPVTVHRIEVEG